MRSNRINSLHGDADQYDAIYTFLVKSRRDGMADAAIYVQLHKHFPKASDEACFFMDQIVYSELASELK